MADTEDTPLEWSGQLHLSPGMVLYLGPGGSAQEHSHLAVQIIRSFDAPFTLITDEGRVTRPAAVVPSGKRHGFESEARRLALALIEPNGPRGRGLDAYAKAIVTGESSVLDVDGDEPASVRELGELLREASPAEPDAEPLSSHVSAALAYLDDAIAGRPRLEDAAHAAHISPARLTHLFTTQVGIPFRRYVLWLRLRLVVEQIGAGANLTEAAIAAGFSDSSHLSRVFRATFGLSPSALLLMRVAGHTWPR